MRNRLEDLWQKMANDGASTPLGIDVVGPRTDVEDLMEAWLRERGQCIELGMLLKRSRRLIARLAALDCVSPEDRKRANNLLLAIKYTLSEAGSDEA